MMASPKPQEGSRPSPLPSRNPLPLSSAQETQVRELYYKRVRAHCADEIREFATCATNRTVSASWACRAQNRAMNKCMVAHATQKEQDAAREEWFAGADQRRLEREEKEKKKREQEKFHQEWWDLPRPASGDGGKSGEGKR